MFLGLEGWIIFAFVAWLAAIVYTPPQSKGWAIACACLLPFIIPLAVFVYFCGVPCQPLTTGHPLLPHEVHALEMIKSISLGWFPLTVILLLWLRKLWILVLVTSIISGALTLWIWLWATMAITGTWL